ncbi:TAF6 [Lepeophtheirus salmonis]|uniref:Transcription initiation factor TFIID subunit 6 n=1 Tax=Lepeophtheirus salmonis TaxID=72036 RepID=A0A7R8H8R8_LEPSM|nr:TAF6 [Lepeophtheirus salmonis]CAF2927677.1 TAF6 [Lepeophtheirus salmonis]
MSEIWIWPTTIEGVLSVQVNKRGEERRGEETLDDWTELMNSMAEERKELGADSIKTAAESLGLSSILHEDAAKELAEHLTYRIRMLIQDAQKYAFHGKRSKVQSEDLDYALRMEGQEPLYGMSCCEYIPFRYASGGGMSGGGSGSVGLSNNNNNVSSSCSALCKEVYFLEDKEIDLSTLISSTPLPKIPMAVSLRSHWLAIDGIQPMIPENPPAKSKEMLKKESSDPLAKLSSREASDNKFSSLLAKLKSTETVTVKQLATHELSVEQQLYYKEITEACVGSDEGRRAEALQSLACDPGLHQMLPRLCTFIAEGVRVNVVQHNLAILIYLMRMVKSLLENQTLFLEKYLHELLPAVITCIVSRQLCSRPEVDNHWALRDFASRLMNNICKNFNTSTNNLQTRVTRLFSEAMKNESSPLVSYYGAIAGLQELGPETIRPLPDLIEEYKADYGSLGAYLHAGVQRSRGTSGSASSAGGGSGSSGSGGGGKAPNTSNVTPGNVGGTKILQSKPPGSGASGSGSTQRIIVVNNQRIVQGGGSI